MWCSTCRQDVPAIAAPEGETGKRCLRCQSVIQTHARPKDEPLLAHHYDDENLGKIIMGCPVDLDDWNLDADLRAVDRLLKSLGKKLRVDEAPPIWSASPAGGMMGMAASSEFEHAPGHYQQEEQRSYVPSAGPETSGNALPWTVLCGSLVALACGAVLLGMAQWGGREDLWTLGLPFALAGQAGLIVGLLLQISGLSFSNRLARATLQELDARETRSREQQFAAAQRTPAPHYGASQFSTQDMQRRMESLTAHLDTWQ